MDLRDKNIIYVGGFGGIGQKCLHEFLKKNIKSLFIFDLYENNEVLQEIREAFSKVFIKYIKLDITKQQNILDAYRQAFEQLGHFDVVVNGSGVMNDRHIDQTVQINLVGVIHSTLTAMKYMDKSVGGCGGVIVNISSVLGVAPNGFFAIYSATKCGVTGFTRALADPLYFARTGISFITICPGFTDTALLDSLHGKETFNLPASLTNRFLLMKHQTATECARNLINAIEIGKNGSIWLLNDGELRELQIPLLWKPTPKI